MCDWNFNVDNWHPDYCKKELEKFETSNADEMVLFRKLHPLDIQFDGNMRLVGRLPNHVTYTELELYRIMVVKRFLITQHMNKKLAIQKKLDDQDEFLKVDGRRVYWFECYPVNDYYVVKFNICKNERSFFNNDVRVKAQLKYNDSELLSESYEVDHRKTKFQRLPKEAKQIIVKVKEDIGYVYELFSKQ